MTTNHSQNLRSEREANQQLSEMAPLPSWMIPAPKRDRTPQPKLGLLARLFGKART